MCSCSSEQALPFRWPHRNHKTGKVSFLQSLMKTVYPVSVNFLNVFGSDQKLQQFELFLDKLSQSVSQGGTARKMT